MKKRMKKVATLCLAGVTAMSTVGVTGSAVFAKGDTNYDVDNMDFENVELRVAFRFNNGSDTDGQAKWYYKALEELSFTSCSINRLKKVCFPELSKADAFNLNRRKKSCISLTEKNMKNVWSGTRMPVLECLSTGDYILSLQEASGCEA